MKLSIIYQNFNGHAMIVYVQKKLFSQHQKIKHSATILLILPILTRKEPVIHATNLLFSVKKNKNSGMRTLNFGCNQSQKIVPHVEKRLANKSRCNEVFLRSFGMITIDTLEALDTSPRQALFLTRRAMVSIREGDCQRRQDNPFAKARIAPFPD